MMHIPNYLVLPICAVSGFISIASFGTSLQEGKAPWPAIIFLGCVIGSFLLWNILL